MKEQSHDDKPGVVAKHYLPPWFRWVTGGISAFLSSACAINILILLTYFGLSFFVGSISVLLQ